MNILKSILLSASVIITGHSLWAQKAILTPRIEEKQFVYSSISNNGNLMITFNREEIQITDIKSGSSVLNYTYESNYGNVLHVVLSHQNNFIGVLHMDESGCCDHPATNESALIFTILSIDNSGNAAVDLSYLVSDYNEYGWQDFEIVCTEDNGFLIKLKSAGNSFGYAIKFGYNSSSDTFRMLYELGSLPDYGGTSYYDFPYPEKMKIKGMSTYEGVVYYDIREESDYCFALAPYKYRNTELYRFDLLPGDKSYGIMSAGLYKKSGKPFYFPVMWDALESYQDGDSNPPLQYYDLATGENVAYLIPDYDNNYVYGVVQSTEIFQMAYTLNLNKKQQRELLDTFALSYSNVFFRFNFETLRFEPIFETGQMLAHPELFAFVNCPILHYEILPERQEVCLIYEFTEADQSKTCRAIKYNFADHLFSPQISIPLELHERIRDVRSAPGHQLHLIVEGLEDNLVKERTVHSFSFEKWQVKSSKIPPGNDLFNGMYVRFDNSEGLKLSLLDRKNQQRVLSLDLSGIPSILENHISEDSSLKYQFDWGKKHWGESQWQSAYLENLAYSICNQIPGIYDDECIEYYSNLGYHTMEDEITAYTSREDYDDLTEYELISSSVFDGVYKYNTLSYFTKRYAYMVSNNTIDMHHARLNRAIYSFTFSERIISVDISADEQLMVVLTLDDKLTLINLKTKQVIAEIYLFENGTDWVIILPDNYYFGTLSATSRIEFLFNMDILSADYFDLKYNRPDIVLKALGYADIQLIEAYEKAFQKRLSRLGLTEDMLKYDFDIPFVEIENKDAIPASTDEGSLKLNYRLFDARYALLTVHVWVNDVAVYGSKGISLADLNQRSYKGSVTIPLANGSNQVVISCMNSIGVESNHETFEVNCKKEKQTNDLFLLTIGVGNYADARYNLSYPAKDANDLSELFKSGELYDSVHVLELTNEKVTLEALKEARHFLENASINDQVIVFVAGHGVLDNNFDYYFATYDMDFQNPSARGIPYEEIERLLDGIKPLKKLLLIDTCHSGEVDKDEIQQGEETPESENDVVFRNVGAAVQNKENQLGLGNTSELVKSLFTDLRKGTGSTVISSAGGVEFAMESDQWKNGLFTYCFINGLLSGNADLNHDGAIMVSEIQNHVQSEVTKLSGGKQTPTSRIENRNLDYRIW